MNISIIGTGYVGLVTGACLSELGMNVICMDTDEEKINKLKSGKISIYEPGLEKIVRRNYFSGRLDFTTNIKDAIMSSKVIFIAVGTPTLDDDSSDLQYVFQVAREIARYMSDYKVIVDKSTVPIGTGQRVKDEINDILRENKKSVNFDVVSNPEFLREGNAVKDFMKPDRIIIGAESEKAFNLMKAIYDTQILLDIPVIFTNIETAEMIKYASNTFLATKVSFINEIANMCELCNADVSIVSKAMGLDNRIGSKFLNPGPGFGGSCFTKDAKALIGIGKKLGYVPKIVKSAVNVNYYQTKRMFKKIKNSVGQLTNRTITILGIAFKPNTDDIREAPAITIIKSLLDNKAKVKAYDPHAMNNIKRFYPDMNIEYCNDIYTACVQSDCIVILTEWEQFKDLDFNKLQSIVRMPILLDLRNMYDPAYVKNFGFEYQGVGRK